MPGFQPDALEDRYAFIGEVSPHLLPKLMALPQGSLRQRVAGLAAWRDALLSGALPEDTVDWPEEALRRPMLERLSALGVARFCAEQPELTDALLADILDAFRGEHDALHAHIQSILVELQRKERRKLKKTRRSEAQLRGLAQQQAAKLLRDGVGRLLKRWNERVRAWQALSEVFDDLQAVLGLGWDLSPGILKQVGWLEVVRLQELLARLPALKALIQQLGRLQEKTEGEPISEQVFAPVARRIEELRTVRTPLVPTEARGVENTGEISRMLPSEAALLHHPTLRRLWHARRAERALMSYRFSGLLTERILLERSTLEQQTRRRPRPERGPIIMCLDTSGSMSGLPETVAKALTLEAMRTAHAEKRRCFLIAFSGPGQVTSQELSLSPGGLSSLMRLLASAFHGGTDIQAPMQEALSLLKKEQWRRADIVIVSDGEFPVHPELLSQVREARSTLSLRVHGVLIGGSHRGGLHQLCQPLHTFTDWRALSQRRV